MKYLAASIVIAAAAAVYGLFSHGVYSYFMTYAFMIPLLGGALPHLIVAMKRADADTASSADEPEESTASEEQKGLANILDARDTQLAIIATLTAGSLLKGVLDIYGTTNRLLIAYPVMAAFILAAVLTVLIKRRENLTRIFSKKI
jgi:hypothetical protein